MSEILFTMGFHRTPFCFLQRRQTEVLFFFQLTFQGVYHAGLLPVRF
jgi:hypothetical protein